MALNGIRSRWSLNGNEWQSLVPLAEWQADIWLFFVIQQSQTANAIVCH